MLQSVTEINGRLTADGQLLVTPDDLKRRTEAGIVARPTDERDLLAKAEASIKSAREAQEREDFALAWAEARRAGRPLRILMYAHWTKAFGDLRQGGVREQAWRREARQATRPVRDGTKPVPPRPSCSSRCHAPRASPSTPCRSSTSGSTGSRGKPGFKFGTNRVRHGHLRRSQGHGRGGMGQHRLPVEGVTARMATIPREGEHGRPDDPDERGAGRTRRTSTRTAPQFFDFPVAAVRSPAIKVEAKNLIRISVLVKRPIASTPGMGGIIVRDSIGGEQFQFRTSDAIPSFSRVVLYRKAPVDGSFTVTLGLAGYGEAFFDDFRVELVEADEGQRRSQPRQPPGALARELNHRIPSRPCPRPPRTRLRNHGGEGSPGRSLSCPRSMGDHDHGINEHESGIQGF